MSTKSPYINPITSIVLISILIIFCSALGFLDTVFALEPLFASGEIAGGKSNSHPIQINAGQMVSGEFVATRNQNLRFWFKEVYDTKTWHLFFETNTRAGFFYAPKTSGQHYLGVTNPDGQSVGTRGYNILCSVKSANVPPGTGSGKNTTEDPTQTLINENTAWWALAIAFIILVIAGFTGGFRREREYIYIFWFIPIRRR